MCSQVRPNEAFGGKGEHARICRQCRALPPAKRDVLKCEHEIVGFLEQSHVSEKNMARLRVLASSGNSRISDLAAVVLDVSHSSHHTAAAECGFWPGSCHLLKRMEESALIVPAALRDNSEPFVHSGPTWDDWVEYAQTCRNE